MPKSSLHFFCWLLCKTAKHERRQADRPVDKLEAVLQQNCLPGLPGMCGCVCISMRIGM